MKPKEFPARKGRVENLSDEHNFITLSSARLLSNYRYLSSLSVLQREKDSPLPRSGVKIPPQGGDSFPAQGYIGRGRQRALRASEGGNPFWVSPSEFEIAPVLKSNAYGHGLLPIAKLLDPLHPPLFCVNSLAEALTLKAAYIKTSILVMGYPEPPLLPSRPLPFHFAVSDKNTLDLLRKFQPHAPLHLFVDTGMHREGIRIDELPQFVSRLKRKVQLNITGLMSHFAQGDAPSHRDTKQQLANFQHAQQILATSGIFPRYFHIAASAALLHQPPDPRLGNLARVGLALYGIDPLGKNRDLRPVLELKSRLLQIKRLKAGESLGYDFTFTASRPMTIGILPIGYADGLDRRLSHQGYVLIGRLACRILGRINMNLTCIDLTPVKNPRLGQVVTIFSSHPQAPNSIFASARLCSTTPYDLLSHLSPSLLRLPI